MMPVDFEDSGQYWNGPMDDCTISRADKSPGKSGRRVYQHSSLGWTKMGYF